MTVKVPDVGELRFMKFAFGVASMGNIALKLYTNNVTQANSDVASTYTEMTTLGYAAKTLAQGTWSCSTTGGNAEALYPQQTFTFTAGTAVTVYGYYLVDVASGDLLLSDSFDTGKSIHNTGDQILITPRILFADKNT